MAINVESELLRIAREAVPGSLSHPEFAGATANLAVVLGPRGNKLTVGPDLCGSFPLAVPKLLQTLADAEARTSSTGISVLALSIDPTTPTPHLVHFDPRIQDLIDRVQHERVGRASKGPPEAVLAEQKVAKSEDRLWRWLIVSWLRALSLDLPIRTIGPTCVAPGRIADTISRLDAASRTGGRADPFLLSVVQVRC